MDDKACVVETDALLRCWKINGAENVDETHPCLAAEQAYISCVGKNVCIINDVFILWKFLILNIIEIMERLEED